MHYCDIFVDRSCFEDFDMESLKPFVYKKREINDKFKLSMKPEIIIQPIESPVEKLDLGKSDDSNIIYPDKRDPLFWCIYIAIHGEFEYLQLRNKDSNKMISEKCLIGQHFSKSIRAMKDSNIKLTLKHIQMMTSDLMINSVTNVDLLTCYAIYYKRKIIITKNNTYMHVTPYIIDGEPIVIDNTHGYGLSLDPNVPSIENTKLEIYNTEKPLKSISSYKVSDLKDLAEKIELSYVSNGKQDLYEALHQKLKW